MRIDWKKIAVLGTTAGMIIVTGCANNVPENNHGNRNGERLTSAMNDNYEGNRVTRSLGGAVRSTERTVRNGANEVKRTTNRATRSINNTAPRGAGAIGDRLAPTAPTHRPARTHAGRINRTTANFRDGVDGNRHLTDNNRVRNHVTHAPNRSITRSNHLNRHSMPIALEDSTYSAQHEQFTGNLLYVDGSKQSPTPQISPNPTNTANPVRMNRSATSRPKAARQVSNTAMPIPTASPTGTTRSTTTTRSAAPVRHTSRTAATMRHSTVPVANLNGITIKAKDQHVKPNVSRMRTRSANRVAPRTSSVRSTTNSNRSMTRSTQRNADRVRTNRAERPERVSNRVSARTNTVRRTTDMNNRIYESYKDDNGALVRRSIENRRSTNRNVARNRSNIGVSPMSGVLNK